MPTGFSTNRRALAVLAAAAPLAIPAAAQTPAPAEYRSAWLTTVYGLDFPGGAGTNIANQRAKIVELINVADNTGCNAILFHVRGECDAMYYSNFEPWSRQLTGTEGTAPARPWDPLQFAIDECRRRGLEVEAWFNPFRGAGDADRSHHASHPLHDMPQIVVRYDAADDDYLWLNPGHPQTDDYNSAVIMDVVSRYDVDGFHFDDYVYPYEVSTTWPFPDSAEYAQYGGGLSLANWRRKNIDDFIDRLKDDVAAVPGKGHVRFGIAPFGIWRPGNPSGISGLDAYNVIYGDSRKWLQQGWVDYLAPQLYWGRAADGFNPQQDFDALLTWWSNPTQNPLGRHVLGGISPSRIGSTSPAPYSAPYTAQTLVNQVDFTRNLAAAKGNIHFRLAMLAENGGTGRGGFSTLLKSSEYTSDATLPAATWMDGTAPLAPTVAWSGSSGAGYTLHWTRQGGEYPQWYIAYWQTNGTWSHSVLPDWQRSLALPGTGASAPANVAVCAVDRSGNRSTTSVFALAGASPPVPPAVESFVVRDGDTIDFTNSSGSNVGVTTSADTSTNEEINNRIDPRVASPGTASRKLPFTWTAPGGLYRIATASANPAIDLTKGVGVYIKLLAGEVDMALGVRETGGSGPIGSTGSLTGPIESTRTQRIKASPNWQYVHFDVPNETWTSFSGGNGVLEGTWGTFESLLVRRVDSSATTAMTLYVDEIHQGPPHTPLGEPVRVDDLAATAQGATSIGLAWEACPAQDLKGYRIYRSTSANVATTPANRIAEIGTATVYSDEGRAPETTYNYVVTAVDHFGYESFPSREASATTAATEGPLDAFAIR